MKILNLDKIKIEDDNDVRFLGLTCDLTTKDFESLKSLDLATIKAAERMANVLNQTTVDKNKSYLICFNFEYCDDDTNLRSPDDFITLVNLLNSNFLGKNLLQLNSEKGRARERRLDVPDNLLGVHTTRRILKNLLNEQTLVDRFNVQIRFNDVFVYNLVDKQSVELGDKYE